MICVMDYFKYVVHEIGSKCISNMLRIIKNKHVENYNLKITFVSTSPLLSQNWCDYASLWWLLHPRGIFFVVGINMKSEVRIYKRIQKSKKK